MLRTLYSGGQDDKRTTTTGAEAANPGASLQIYRQTAKHRSLNLYSKPDADYSKFNQVRQQDQRRHYEHCEATPDQGKLQ